MKMRKMQNDDKTAICSPQRARKVIEKVERSKVHVNLCMCIAIMCGKSHISSSKLQTL